MDTNKYNSEIRIGGETVYRYGLGSETVFRSGLGAKQFTDPDWGRNSFQIRIGGEQFTDPDWGRNSIQIRIGGETVYRSGLEGETVYRSGLGAKQFTDPNQKLSTATKKGPKT